MTKSLTNLLRKAVAYLSGEHRYCMYYIYAVDRVDRVQRERDILV
jgi:hypothetical protein